tara:strand:+ start:169 stop:987 length:819 start_codon:yes stop_codon:yes gene_type:complete
MDNKAQIQNLLQNASWMTGKDPALASEVASYLPKKVYKFIRNGRFVKRRSGKYMFVAAMLKVMRENNVHLFRAPDFKTYRTRNKIYYWRPNGNHVRYVLKNKEGRVIYSYVFDKNKYYRVQAEEDDNSGSTVQILGDKSSDEEGKAMVYQKNLNLSWLQGQDEALERIMAKTVGQEIEDMYFPDEKGDILFEYNVLDSFKTVRHDIVGVRDISPDEFDHAEIHVGSIRTQRRRRRRSRRRSTTRRRSRRSRRRSSTSRRRSKRRRKRRHSRL